MKKLIITEKPHLSKFVISCIRESFAPKKINQSNSINYYESDNYVVTHALGHLFEAYDIEDYTKNPAEWNLDILPFFPPENNFYFKLKQILDEKTRQKKVDPRYKLQFEVILNLVNRSDISSIIHCGDAGREGEIIVRQILRNTNKENKPVYRLWFSEETSDAFYQSFNNMLPDSEYDNWANEGFARLKIDWIYGINLTRYVSLKAGAPKGFPLRTGRVLGGMTNEIFERDMEILNFTPEDYYVLISDMETNGESIHLRSKNTFPISEERSAQNRCNELNAAGASVTDIKKETKTVGPGKLYSLNSLQIHLNKAFNMSLSDSEAAAQAVYEKGFITYPRTNSEYLGSHEKEEIKNRIELFKTLGYDLAFRDSKLIFDDSKIEDHSALLPTKKIPNESELKDNELKVYEAIRNRFLAVFCAIPCTIDKTTMRITCDTEEFVLSGSILISKGFLEYDYKEMKDTFLPDLKIGDIVRVNFKPTKEATKPPSHYTVSTFMKFLEFPFQTEKSTEEERYNAILKGLEIGTVATRTQIINNMLKCGYVKEHNNVYTIEPLGIYYIHTLKKLGIDMSKEKTVELSVLLKKVNHGELSEIDAIEESKKDVIEMFGNRNISIQSCIDAGVLTSSGYSGESLGNCPVCNGNVYETPTCFKCENNKKNDPNSCSFVIFKEDSYIKKVTDKKVTSSNVKSILKKSYFIGTTKTKDKKGTYEVLIISIVKEDGTIGWKIDYDIGKCPICGSRVKITPFGYICENNDKEDKEKCFFILYRNDKFINAYTKKPLSLKSVLSLLKDGSFKITTETKDKSDKYSLKLSLIIDRQERKISWHKDYVKKGKK